MAITIEDKESALIGEIIAILQGAKVGTDDVFATVARDDSTDEAEQKRITKSGGVSVVYEDTEEHGLPDKKVGCVMTATLMIFTRAGNITSLVNAAKNALKTTPPASSRTFAADGELYRSVSFGEIEKDTSQDPWVIAELPTRIAFVISDEVSH